MKMTHKIEIDAIQINEIITEAIEKECERKVVSIEYNIKNTEVLRSIGTSTSYLDSATIQLGDKIDNEHQKLGEKINIPKRFTAYRRNISQRDSHTKMHKNADSEPQFEGVVWSDGSVTLRWLTPSRSTSVWKNLYSALVIHGHPEYGTEIIWHDWDTPPQEWVDQLEAAALSVKEK